VGLDKETILNATDKPALVCELLPELKAVGTDQALVCCIYHDEKNPSMSVQVNTGKHNCRGCGVTGTIFDLMMKTKSLDFAAACQFMANRAGLKNEQEKINFKVVGKYLYCDAEGNLAYWKERVEPGFNGKSKVFFFFHGNDIKPGQGFYLSKEKKKPYNGRGKSEHLPYRLPELLNATPDEIVFVPEGEKKCDFLASWGLVATCLDCGGTTKPNQLFIDSLTGRHVVILPDNDSTGEQYADTLTKALYGVAASIKVLRLPELKAKGDVLDWAKVKP